MGRLTQAIEYLNSEAKDWNKTPVKLHYSQFTHLNISDSYTKLCRRYVQYGKENETFKEFKKR